MKKVLGINGSARKNWNTAQMLEKALEGAASIGAETRMVHLYDLVFTGCKSCFNCKSIENPITGCALQDDLTPVLNEAMQSDILIMATPIYFTDVSSAMRAFWERLLFMNLTYDQNQPSKFTGNIATGMIYTMNTTLEAFYKLKYDELVKRNLAGLIMLLNGPAEYVIAADTTQFEDYLAYMSNMFDPGQKAAVRREQFPKDLLAAFEMGAKLGALSPSF